MTRELLNSLSRAAVSTAGALQRHPRRVAAALGSLLLGTGVTAFGIAPLAPDAADLPVTQVVEALDLRPLQLPAELQTSAGMTLFRSDLVRRDDSAQSLLRRLDVRDASALAHLRTDALARQLFTGRSGKLVSVETDDQHRLLRLVARWLPDDERRFSRLVIELGNTGWRSRLESGDLQSSTRLASGTIRSSLFAATDDANLPDSVAVQLAELFSNDIDFRRDLRAGDRFSVVYESLEADGEPMRAGRVLSAQFVNAGKSYDLVWFQDGDQKGDYFGFDGQSTRKSFLGSPLAFTRVTSGYGMRFHPISGKLKAHLGVDYAAPTGTPVRTIGDGVVSFAGVQRGYGNVIEITHKNQQSTLFAHLSRIDVRQGQRVEQGETIGAVGSTGSSTGPHLHFEFRDHGEHQDPLQIARQSENIPVNPALRARFTAVAQAQRLQLDAAASLQQARAE